MAQRAPRTPRLLRRTMRVLVTHVVLLLLAAVPAHAGVVLAPTAITLTEGGPGVDVQVTLSEQPTGPIELTPEASQAYSWDTASFTPLTWNVPQTITVYAHHDYVVEPAGVTDTLVFRDQYGTVHDPGLPITFGADGTPHVTIREPSNRPEGGAEGETMTWTIALESEPAAAVTVAIEPDPQFTFSPSSVTIQPEDWATPVPVQFHIVEDGIAEDSQSADIRALTSSGDPAYDGIHVRYSYMIWDAVQPGIRFGSPGPVAVIEGGTARTYTVALASAPTYAVDIDLASLSGQASVDPSVLRFEPGTWDVPQTVSVQAVQDTDPEPSPHADAILHTANSADPAYASPTLPDMPVEVTDDDSPGILVEDPESTELSEADSEGTERTFLIRLATAPVGQVSIAAQSDGQVMLMQGPLVFDASNWSTAQALRVRAYDDAVAEGPHTSWLGFQVSAPDDPTYASFTIASRSFQIIDDDAANAGIDCVPGTGWNVDADGIIPTSEDGIDAPSMVSCSLQLRSPSASRVTVNIAGSPSGQVTASRTSVVFEPGQQGPEEVQFTVVDDDVAEGRHEVSIGFGVVSSDPVYGTLSIPPAQLSIADDDVVGILVDPVGPIEVREGASAATVSVSLRSRPTASVSLLLAPDPQLELVDPAGGTLAFTPETWNVPQLLGVRAVDDEYSEPSPLPAAVAVQVLSSDAGYLEHVAAPIAYSVLDDDVAGVKVTRAVAADVAVTEGAGPERVTIELTTRPRHPVTVTLTADAQLVPIDPAQLTFTPTDWDVPQAIQLQSAQDTVFEGAHEGRVTFALASDDPMYANGSSAQPTPLVLRITDDEEGGIAITETDGATAVSEAGGTDTYSVVLSAQPTADVVIRIDGSGQVGANPPALTFTPTNWNAAQTVTLVGLQDDVDEADPHIAEVRHVVETQALGWAGLALPTIQAKVADDDVAEIVVVQSDGSTKVAEGSKVGDTIGLHLKSQPTKDVTITPAADAQLSVDTKPLVLTPAAWKDPLELRVLAIDDQEREDTHTGTITFTVRSEDPNFAKAVVSAITVEIADNDSDVTIMPDGDGSGGDEEEETAVGRTPRDGGGSTSTGGTSDGSGSTTVERRTDDGATRTEDGATRTEDGLGSFGGGSGSRRANKDDDEAEVELVAAAEEEQPRHKPRRTPKPNPVIRAVNRASDWVQANKETAATVGGLGLMTAGAGTFLLRGDPIKAAQRGMSKLPVSGGEGGDRPHARRVRGAKKRRRDEDDDDATNS